MSKVMVTIPENEYEQLLADRRLLDALLDRGVEEWDGYEDALLLANEDDQ